MVGLELESDCCAGNSMKSLGTEDEYVHTEVKWTLTCCNVNPKHAKASLSSKGPNSPPQDLVAIQHAPSLKRNTYTIVCHTYFDLLIIEIPWRRSTHGRSPI